MKPAIKTASSNDQDGLIGVLTLAFSSDPMARWSQPDPHMYLQIFPQVTWAFGGGALERGTAYFADGYAGAAHWLPPGVSPDEEKLTQPPEIKVDIHGVFELMEKYHPKEPHWYRR